ncbi:RHS repeat domain-containing protein [Treponema sp. OMZ 788]|uniref:RHS repeat domain-containing protein n=1 Tax=Treponema sp. OMZ 788 TaxID=2563664 RepID=UPI0020A57CC3|nr:RHS repeat-associated core domain-containing protein [Treponema sp. OMZ 788]
MNPKPFIYSHPKHLTFRTAIEREQKQFIKIAFAVHLSAVISAERYRSDSVALKSAVFNFVFFVMLKNKIEQSAKRKLLLNKIILPDVFPLTARIDGSGKTMAFENRHVGCKEREKINRRCTLCTLRINFFEATPQTTCIFSKEYYRYDANGNITAEKDGPFTDEEEFVFTYSYFENEDVYGADYGFGLDAPKETEQSNPQDLFAYRRNYTWNERNLLTKSSDRNYTVHYRYGEDGQRALKYTDEGRSETLYFNNFFTIHIPTQDQNNPQGLRVHKHIFVGNSRLVTAMTHTDNQGDNDEQKVKRYYYHSDHLGSAQFVTDWKGRQYEHIEYTPYGELWIEETGLYYYGARYLDPKYSRWLSGDPALNDYIPKAPIDDEAKKHNENLPGLGGVFNVVNLHVYHYAGNNPVKYVDPDGESVVVVTAVVVWGVNALLLTIGIIDAAGPSKAEHLARNDNQAGLAPSDRETMDKLVKLGLFSDWGNTGTHNLSGDDTVMNRLGGLVLGARGSNKDYRGATGTVFEGCQFVYDSNGKLVTDSLNQGTFDTASPSGVSGVIKHSVKDVSPWLKWGNGTANNQVMSAELENSIKNIYNDFDGGKISKDQAKNEIENLVKNYIKHNNLE